MLRSEQGQQDERQGRRRGGWRSNREQLESTVARHELIGQHQVEGRILRQLLQGFVDAPYRDDRIEARQVEFSGEAGAADREVVDDEDAPAQPDGLAALRQPPPRASRVTQKHDPRPLRSARRPSPPISSARRLTIDSPRPVPP